MNMLIISQIKLNLVKVDQIKNFIEKKCTIIQKHAYTHTHIHIKGSFTKLNKEKGSIVKHFLQLNTTTSKKVGKLIHIQDFSALQVRLIQM